MLSRFIRSVTLKMLNMGHLIVIGDVDVFNVQWFLYNTSLSTFLNSDKDKEFSSISHSDMKHLLTLTRDVLKYRWATWDPPLAGPLDSDWRFDSLCGSHLQSQRELQGCQLSRIIRETPDFKLFLPVSRLESDISQIISKVCQIL